jgi:hypothetical protein
MFSLSTNPRASSLRSLRSLQSLPAKELILYVTIAAGSVWLLAKLLRAIAHYAFPK